MKSSTHLALTVSMQPLHPILQHLPLELDKLTRVLQPLDLLPTLPTLLDRLRRLLRFALEDRREGFAVLAAGLGCADGRGEGEGGGVGGNEGAVGRVKREGLRVDEVLDGGTGEGRARMLCIETPKKLSVRLARSAGEKGRGRSKTHREPPRSIERELGQLPSRPRQPPRQLRQEAKRKQQQQRCHLHPRARLPPLLLPSLLPTLPPLLSLLLSHPRSEKLERRPTSTERASTHAHPARLEPAAAASLTEEEAEEVFW